MLKYNYLASNSIYLSYYHTVKELKLYIKYCDKVFEKIFKLLNKKNSIKKLSKRTEDFKRLT